jgi:RNA polymerase sigma-70 factor (ECF subfamily)
MSAQVPHSRPRSSSDYEQANSGAIEELVSRLSPLILRFLTAQTQMREDDAEDVLQDFWLRLHRARHTYRPGEPPLPWIFAIARHTSLDAYRRRRRISAREVTFPEIPENLCQSPEPTIDRGEFLSALEQLPARQREVILMLKVAGMSLEEVARATCVSVGSVKQRAHRAYAKLRFALAPAQ